MPRALSSNRLTARDSTFEVLSELIERPIPGFGELFRFLSYAEIQSAAMLSRALAGTVSNAVVFGLPGSTKGASLGTEMVGDGLHDRARLRVEQALHGYIRPLLRRDGGDVEIIDIKDTLIYCRLAGSCQGCAGASQTLRMLVEQNLKDLVDERIRVIEV